MFRSKYSGITWYCHNFGKYDIYFIMKTLMKHKSDVFKFDFVFRDNFILKVKIIKTLDNNRKKSITICDSYPILTDSLYNLCKKFKVENVKGIFPHTFANENTLFYIGETPSINHFNVTSKVYSLIYTHDWNFKLESNKYLIKDLLSLHDVISKANHEFFINFNINITDGLTISGLAYKIFIKDHYKENSIPLINNKKYYNDIKKSYYGGITEVYKPYGENLYYYDVNSLYPLCCFKWYARY